ncbi:MAG TPA: hypothetical protein VJA23_06000 [Candidatus Nanoarchaeia archaeon]|nr:hypothetical protein [Candidatus Nanoarchaeia archaeon]
MWLFGKKKLVPRVPFPAGKAFDEKALRFPKRELYGKIIEPDEVHAALGLNLPPLPREEKSEFPPLPEEREESPFPFKQPFGEQKSEPTYVKVGTYQQILEEISEMRKTLVQMREANKRLHSSEYNEEHNFIRLRNATKVAHDKLLQIDKIISKGD